MRLRSVPGIAAIAVAYLPTAYGALFVTDPSVQTKCHGGQPCLVQWLDDGEKPLLAAMGPCYVALYSGNQRLVQQIEPIDVSTSHSLTFTPNRTAGQNSSTYYVEFKSVNATNASEPLLAYSPNFSIDQMTGSFESPIAELTSTIPVPSSVLSAHLYSVPTSILSGSIPASTPTSSSYRSIPSSSSTPASSSTTTVTTMPFLNAATQHVSRLWALTFVGIFLQFLH